jgi:hypothetical protein
MPEIGKSNKMGKELMSTIAIFMAIKSNRAIIDQLALIQPNLNIEFCRE